MEGTMGSFEEYHQYDGLGLAELIRKNEVSAQEVCQEAIRRIDDVNPAINAVITPMYDIARQFSQESIPEGPFTGVPFLLKDLMAVYAGVPLTNGCRGLRNYVPDYDSELVKRYKNPEAVYAR
jgi:amidase